MTRTGELRAVVAAPANITGIVEMWPLLVEERIPGTSRPWMHTRTKGHRPEVDDDTGTLIYGVTAPVRLDVLDAMQDTLRWVRRTHREVATALGIPRPRHHSGDPVAPLVDLAAWWPDLEASDEALATKVAGGLQRHRDVVVRHLGLMLDGKVLPFACPYCLTPSALQVRRDEELGPVITCTSGSCTPPPRASTHLTRDHLPVWRFAQWLNLSAACEEQPS